VVDALQPLFDQAVKPDAAEKFLRQDGHHLLVAFVQSLPVGFVSGVELTHPDKGTDTLLRRSPS
ncbi:MAG TPA: GNAT family N-acetyltransferase, partial [Chloroflexota bacterium]|nr:GNAT family N-acetyltransferase [Chloroflexota bacterium]